MKHSDSDHYSIDVIGIIEFPDGTVGQVGVTLHNDLPAIVDKKFVLTAEELKTARQNCASADLHISDWTHLNKGYVLRGAEKETELTSPANTSAIGKPRTARKQLWISGVGGMTVSGRFGLVNFEGGAIDEATPRFFEVGGGLDLLDGIRLGDFVVLELFETKVRAEVHLSITKKGTIFIDGQPVLRALARRLLRQ